MSSTPLSCVPRPDMERITMEIIKPRTLSGFMELLPEKQLKFDRMAEVLRKTYASYGFAPLDTPVIEDAQILLAKGGGETEKQIYRFTKGDSDLALRFDLTVPLAKYVALHYNELASPSAATRAVRAFCSSICFITTCTAARRPPRNTQQRPGTSGSGALLV